MIIPYMEQKDSSTPPSSHIRLYNPYEPLSSCEAHPASSGPEAAKPHQTCQQDRQNAVLGPALAGEIPGAAEPNNGCDCHKIQIFLRL